MRFQTALASIGIAALVSTGAIGCRKVQLSWELNVDSHLLLEDGRPVAGQPVTVCMDTYVQETKDSNKLTVNSSCPIQGTTDAQGELSQKISTVFYVAKFIGSESSFVAIRDYKIFLVLAGQRFEAEFEGGTQPSVADIQTGKISLQTINLTFKVKPIDVELANLFAHLSTINYVLTIDAAIFSFANDHIDALSTKQIHILATKVYYSATRDPLIQNFISAHAETLSTQEMLDLARRIGFDPTRDEAVMQYIHENQDRLRTDEIKQLSSWIHYPDNREKILKENESDRF